MSRQLLIVHLSGPWAAFHRRHMLVALAATLPDSMAMLCVDRPTTIIMGLFLHPVRFFRHIWRASFRRESAKLFVANVRIPIHDLLLSRVPWMSGINARLLAWQLRRIVRDISSEPTEITQWIYAPEQFWVAAAFPGSKLIYECYDEYARDPGGALVALRWQREIEVLRRTDLCFVTTTPLLERRSAYARRIAILPNGIPDSFLDAPAATADPIDMVPHPRVVYSGVVRRPLAVGLLRAVFSQRQDWHLVFVGPVLKNSGVRLLRDLPNVHFMGVRPFDLLPGTLRKADIGLIPYQVNEFSHVFRPLKLYEYLSAGLPIAASRLSGLAGLDEFLAYYEPTAQSMITAIENALGRRGPQFADSARSWVTQFTWSRIAERDVIPHLKSLRNSQAASVHMTDRSAT